MFAATSGWFIQLRNTGNVGQSWTKIDKVFLDKLVLPLLRSKKIHTAEACCNSGKLKKCSRNAKYTTTWPQWKALRPKLWGPVDAEEDSPARIGRTGVTQWFEHSLNLQLFIHFGWFLDTTYSIFEQGFWRTSVSNHVNKFHWSKCDDM